MGEGKGTTVRRRIGDEGWPNEGVTVARRSPMGVGLDVRVRDGGCGSCKGGLR